LWHQLARWAEGGEISVGTSGGNSHTIAGMPREFRYAPPLTANTLVIGVTQSGETADALAATMEKTASVRSTARYQPRLLGITNRGDSSLATLVKTNQPILSEVMFIKIVRPF